MTFNIQVEPIRIWSTSEIHWHCCTTIRPFSRTTTHRWPFALRWVPPVWTSLRSYPIEIFITFVRKSSIPSWSQTYRSISSMLKSLLDEINKTIRSCSTPSNRIDCLDEQRSYCEAILVRRSVSITANKRRPRTKTCLMYVVNLSPIVKDYTTETFPSSRCAR